MQSWPIMMCALTVTRILEKKKFETRRIPNAMWGSIKEKFDSGEDCYLWVKEAARPSFPRALTSPDLADDFPKWAEVPPSYRHALAVMHKVDAKPGYKYHNARSRPRWAARIT